MMTLMLICLLVGAVLGQRFKVLVLVPVMALALPLSAAAAITQSAPFWQTVLTALTAATGLQIGYLAGTGIRYLLAATRARGACASSALERYQSKTYAK